MAYTVTHTPLQDVLVLEPQVFGDQRGFFFESFNQRDFERATGSTPAFVQDNHRRSRQGVLRGLHYQIEHPQGKLVRVTHGEVFDFALDLRRASPTFGKWFGMLLSAGNRRQLWIPAGFAHGFLVTSEAAEFLYKTTDYYYPQHERTVLWNDPQLAIEWPLEGEPVLAAKDLAGKSFAAAEVFDGAPGERG
jgi:dTDP-4-dehydrorhamnose 3,5-epimerase